MVCRCCLAVVAFVVVCSTAGRFDFVLVELDFIVDFGFVYRQLQLPAYFELKHD